MTAVILLTLVCSTCSRVTSNSLHKSSLVCHYFTYQHTISHYTVEIHTLPPFLWNTWNTEFICLLRASDCCVTYQAWWKGSCLWDCLRLRQPCPLLYQAPDKYKSETCRKFRARRYDRNKTIQNKDVQQVEKSIFLFVKRSDLPTYSTRHSAVLWLGSEHRACQRNHSLLDRNAYWSTRSHFTCLSKLLRYSFLILSNSITATYCLRM